MKKGFFIFFTAITVFLFAQTDTLTPVTKKILIHDNITRFDTVSVWPFQIRLLKGTKPVADSLWQVNAVQAFIVWKQKKYPRDSLTIFYWRYPEAWYQAIATYPEVKVLKKNRPNPVLVRQTGFFEGLEAEGFWEKGAMSGNRMNTSSQGILALRLKGEMAPGVRLTAHIRDDNLPYGYQGISTPVKDINRIFLSVVSEHWHVSGGDSLWQFKSPLVAFERDNKGIGFGLKNDRQSLDINVALVKGKFGRNVFTLQTAQYGPFKLHTGTNDYIYILHGTEKVYLNGIKLDKKQYTIDYGTGEVRLNPSLDIKAYDRMVVEYQYANTFYRRWTTFSVWQKNTRRNRIRFFSFNETDMPRQNMFFSPDSATVETLQQIPDPQNMRFLAAKPSGWDDNKILYTKEVNGNRVIFRYASEPGNLQLYEVRFRYVGKQKGDYVVEQITGKGKIMRYAGNGNGDYTPSFPLNAPENNWLTGVEWNYSDSLIRSDNQLVFNKFNPNMFYLSKSNIQYTLAFHSKTDRTIYTRNGAQHTLGYEIRQLPSRYHPGDRLFEPDFENDWDLNNAQGKHRFYALNWSYSNDKNQIIWQPAFLQLRDSIKLFHMSLHNDLGHKFWHWHGKHFWLKGQKNPGDKTLYFGSVNRLSYHRGHWTPAIQVDFRKRNDKISGWADSLNYAYVRIEPSIGYKTPRNSFKLQTGQTRVDSIRQGRFTRVSNQRQVRFQALHKQKNFNTSLTIGYLTDAYHRGNNQWLVITSVEWNDRNNITPLRISLSRYADKTSVREVVYTRVPDGQGQYRWIDYNGNGIEDPDEFEPAYYSDQADYIRVLLPSNRFINTYRSQAKIEWILQPSQTGKRPRRFNWQNRLDIDIDFQHTGNSLEILLSPVRNLLNGHQRINNTWNWQFKPGWQIEYQFALQQNSENLYYGLKRNFMRIHQWRLSKTFARFWKAAIRLTKTTHTHFEEEFPLKNYHLEKTEYGFPLSFKNKDFSFVLQWQKDNAVSIHSVENLQSVQWKVRLQYHRKKSRWDLDAAYIRNHFQGNFRSPAAYIMLRGLHPGKNYTQSISWQYRLGKNTHLILQYHWRVSENNPPVHTGQIKIRMDF